MNKRPVVHLEIPAADRALAARFYSELFGWETQDMPHMNYTTFESGSLEGGFYPLSAQTKPGDVLFYIHSDDIEADLKLIEEKGGKTVLSKTEIAGVGWFAFFSDPTGNRIGLFKYGGGGS